MTQTLIHNLQPDFNAFLTGGPMPAEKKSKTMMVAPPAIGADVSASPEPMTVVPPAPPAVVVPPPLGTDNTVPAPASTMKPTGFPKKTSTITLDSDVILEFHIICIGRVSQSSVQCPLQ